MPDPQTFTRGELAPHWNALAHDVERLCIKGQRFGIQPGIVGETIVASFFGQSVRRAGRNKGSAPVPVVQLRAIPGGWEAWIGYREVWTLSRGTRRYLFGSADLTVFCSPADAEAFQQVFRAEWVGMAKTETEWSFRPHDAGHPHWQIDIGETLRADAGLRAARDLLSETQPKEFGGSSQTTTSDPPWYHIERMHFASAVRPWLDGAIAHQPEHLSAIRSWTARTLVIVRDELARLQGA